MTTAKQRADSEREEAIARLREMAPQGATLFTVLRHVSASGMSRRISVYVIENNYPYMLDGQIARLGLYKLSKERDGIVVNGCGMDIGFDIVYNTSRMVWRDVVGEGECGYVYKHQWI